MATGTSQSGKYCGVKSESSPVATCSFQESTAAMNFSGFRPASSASSSRVSALSTAPRSTAFSNSPVQSVET